MGAIAALIFAALAVRGANAQLRMLRDDRFRDHADKISVWVERHEPGKQLVFSNTSNVPVYMIVCWTRTLDDADGRDYDVLPSLNPGVTRKPFNCPARLQDSFMFAGVIYRDSAGRFWERTITGELKQISQEEFSVRNAEFRQFEGYVDELEV